MLNVLEAITASVAGTVLVMKIVFSDISTLVNKNGPRFTLGLDSLLIIQFQETKVMGELERPEFF